MDFKTALFYILSAILVIASLVLMALAPDYHTALIARVLGGAFAGGVIPVSLALLSDRSIEVA